MAAYKTRLLPLAEVPRAYVIGSLQRDGATLYYLANSPSEGIESRETWPPGTIGTTPVPTPLPAEWILIAS
jgi:hypothetical protein